jgi:signal transduction histidine kinase
MHWSLPWKGTVSLRFSSGSDPNDFTSETLTKLKSDEILSVYIQDNGIGISEDIKEIISNIPAGW